MKVLKMMPIGAALFSLCLGLSSVAPFPARADDEDSGTKAEKNLIRVVQEDQEGDQGSDRASSSSGYLGVQVQRLSPSLRRARGIPESTEGALVSNVEDQGPADDGGIKRGDVILEVNREGTANPIDLVRIVRDLEPGRRIPVKIWRDGVTRTVNLMVGTRPAESAVPPRMPGMEGPGGMRGMPEMHGPDDNSQMRILRGGSDDLGRQLRDIHEMLSRLRDVDLARLEREIRDLRTELQRGGALERKDRESGDRDPGDRGRDRNDRDRGEKDRGDSESD